MKKKEAMVSALQKELALRQNEFKDEAIKTIYFGGGTPSVLSSEQINEIIEAIHKNYKVSENLEITLEANPDDLSNNRIIELSNSPINRLSIGIQSFFDEDLQLLNRAHNAQEAQGCISEASRHFGNISIDLIYGIPGVGNERWKENIERALSFDIPHISSYALTVEPKTALAHMIQKGQVQNVDDEQAQEQFYILVDALGEKGFVHYEISNFGKEGYFSKNNTAYWQGKKYLGIGPSAHSFNGTSRGWNVRNNSKYLKAIQGEELPMEVEVLSKIDRYNEYIMTGLRTIWGISLNEIATEYGNKYYDYLLKQSSKPIEQKLLVLDGDILKVTKKGKFLADGIAADLFYVEME